MTHWFASTSLWKTSWPVSGHLIQRFSGTSRRCRNERIFGRTTFDIQFMTLFRKHYVVALGRGRKPAGRSFGCHAPRRAHALGERSDEIAHRLDGFRASLSPAIEARANRFHEGRADHDGIGG